MLKAPGKYAFVSKSKPISQILTHSDEVEIKVCSH